MRNYNSAFQCSFGPVPSRRLGMSLGINNIPSKICSYACIYCQAGQTSELQVDRRSYYEPDDIFEDTQRRLAGAKEASERVDYLTFVPNGEPTLDLNLGREIEHLKALNVPVGVITNASLLTRSDVREELSEADWVSIKVDTVIDEIWQKINRPHSSLRLSAILHGIREFAAKFSGKLSTETMLIEDLNDNDDSIQKTANFLSDLGQWKSYIGAPTRPPAENSARGPDEQVLNKAYQIFALELNNVEYLTSYEGDHFFSYENAETEILAIASVHPLREDSMMSILSRKGLPQEIVNRLVEGGELSKIEYKGRIFYARRPKRCF